MQDRDTHMLDGATARLVMPFERAVQVAGFAAIKITLYGKGSSNCV